MLNVQTPIAGPRIREARQELGLSQKRFAERLGTTRRRVIAWESGENVPSALYLRRIAEATGKSIEYFLDGSAADDPEERLPSDDLMQIVRGLERMVDQRVMAALGSRA